LNNPSAVFADEHRHERCEEAAESRSNLERGSQMTTEQVGQLTHAFQARFGADVDSEPVNEQGRYRFAVTSQQFESMSHLDRQDALWAVVDETLPREASLDVSLILAFSPSELGIHSAEKTTGLFTKDTNSRPEQE
jgi:hypothetical protein